MKYVAFLALLGAVSLAGQTRKPACTAKNHGQFWPEEANSDPAAARQLYQSGELELCSLEVWKYRWEHVSVKVRKLGKGKRTSTADRKQEGEIK